MKAIILAGGYATRLRPITYALPKLLFPVLGKPMIYWTLDLLRKFSVSEVILGVNYLADLLRRRVGTSYKGMKIRYSLEKFPLGTAGPIKLAAKGTSLNETFIAMNGDVIADIDISRMLMRHAETGAAITDAVHEVADPTRFGVVQLDSVGRIRKFVEKPKLREAPSRLVNAGIYLIEPQVLDMIPPGRRVSLEREIFPRVAREGKLSGFPFSGYWFDIGSLTDYQKANFDLLGRLDVGTVFRRKSAKVAKDATLRPPLYLGRSLMIESKASVGPFVLTGKNVLIEAGARVSNSILFDRVTIGEGSKVSGAILASDVTLGKGVIIESGSVVSPNVQVTDGVRIGRNTTVHPHKEIRASVKPGAHVM